MKNHRPVPTSIFIVTIAAVMLTACGYQPRLQAPGSADSDFYRPPTISAVNQQQTPTGQASEGDPGSGQQVTATVTCTDQLSFITDVTIPDGTVVEPGSTLDKRWEVENSGSCNWDDQYKLKLISGPEMGIEPEQKLFPARAGTRPVIRIMFTAPMEPGRYRSAWQAFNPQDQPFGDQFFIEILVGNP